MRVIQRAARRSFAQEKFRVKFQEKKKTKRETYALSKDL